MTTPTEPTEPPVVEPNEVEPTEPLSPNAEAAKYRVRAKDAETARDDAIAERDALTERLTGFDRRTAESMAADALDAPSDLWVAGIEIDALRGIDGEIDADLVNVAVAEVLEAHPNWSRIRTPLSPPGMGPQTGYNAQPASWSDVIGR